QFAEFGSLRQQLIFKFEKSVSWHPACASNNCLRRLRQALLVGSGLVARSDGSQDGRLFI
ncbi:MAG TPA: hypothetical protein VMB21_04420, partial [Candidatus Limnocylindria bacterium]|nr:hypothetical protein [Candidatus Limnocylindria bacterium]